MEIAPSNIMNQLEELLVEVKDAKLEFETRIRSAQYEIEKLNGRLYHLTKSIDSWWIYMDAKDKPC